MTTGSDAPDRGLSASDDAIVREVYESVQRCQLQGGFISRFYENFTMSSDEVAEQFRETDMATQERMVMASLHLMMLGHSGGMEKKAHYERLARLHGREHLDIPPKLYDEWLDSLIRAVAECDPEFCDEVEEAWRSLLAPGIRYMKSHR